jgi:hypothetical protein
MTMNGFAWLMVGILVGILGGVFGYRRLHRRLHHEIALMWIDKTLSISFPDGSPRGGRTPYGAHMIGAHMLGRACGIAFASENSSLEKKCEEHWDKWMGDNWKNPSPPSPPMKRWWS